MAPYRNFFDTPLGQQVASIFSAPSQQPDFSDLFSNPQRTNFSDLFAEARQPAAAAFAQANQARIAAEAAKVKNPYAPNTTPNTPVEPAGTFDKAIENAKSLLGTKYIMGSAVDLNDPKPKTIDCSSLVQWAYGRAGIKLPRTAQQQYEATTRINKDQLQPGDLIFFTGTYDAGRPVTHVGIYLGNGLMINATGSVGDTVIQRIDTPYWSAHYYGCGRVASPVSKPPLASRPTAPPTAPYAAMTSTAGFLPG